MLCYAVVIAFAISVVRGYPILDDGDEYIVPNNTEKCTQDLVNWCESMKYPNDGNVGISMTSITISNPNGVFRVICVSDNDGTNCTKNGQAWFACNKDNQFFYQGSLVTNASETDYNMCETADNAFNDLMLQNLKFGNNSLTKEFEKGMEGFFETMAEMYQEIEVLKQRMKMIPMWYDYYPFRNYDTESVKPGYDLIPQREEQGEREYNNYRRPRFF